MGTSSALSLLSTNASRKAVQNEQVVSTLSSALQSWKADVDRAESQCSFVVDGRGDGKGMTEAEACATAEQFVQKMKASLLKSYSEFEPFIRAASDTLKKNKSLLETDTARVSKALDHLQQRAATVMDLHDKANANVERLAEFQSRVTKLQLRKTTGQALEERSFLRTLRLIETSQLPAIQQILTRCESQVEQLEEMYRGRAYELHSGRFALRPEVFADIVELQDATDQNVKHAEHQILSARRALGGAHPTDEEASKADFFFSGLSLSPSK
jgi:uncharacterized protein YukE